MPIPHAFEIACHSHFPAILQTHPFWSQIPGDEMIPSPSGALPDPADFFAFLPCVNAESVEIRRRETVNILWPTANRRRPESAPPMNNERGAGVVEQNILKRERILYI